MEWVQVAAFWTSALMALIAIASVIISYNVLRASTDPEVILFAQPDDKRPSIVNLVVKNIGKSSALNVSFNPERQLPTKAFGFENAEMPDTMTDGPLINGIPYIAPNQEFIITWGQYGGLSRYMGTSQIDVHINYQRTNSLVPSMKNRHTVSRLDIKSWEQTNSNDHNWDKKAVEELKQLNTNINRLINNFEILLKHTKS